MKKGKLCLAVAILLLTVSLVGCNRTADTEPRMDSQTLENLTGRIGQFRVAPCGDTAQELWNLSTAVVVGEIVSREKTSLSDYPQSLIGIEIEDCLKGDLQGLFYTTCVGYPIAYSQAKSLSGREEYEWIDLAPLAYLPIGDRVLLFLDAPTPSLTTEGLTIYPTQGMSQGVFLVDDQDRIQSAIPSTTSQQRQRSVYQSVLEQGTLSLLQQAVR